MPFGTYGGQLVQHGLGIALGDGADHDVLMRHLSIAEFCPVQPHGHQLQLDRKAEHRHGLGVGQVAGTDGLQRGGGRLVLGRALDRMLTGTVGVDAAAGGGEVIIQPGQRVGALAAQQHLEVQVRAKNVAGGTAVADQLALLDLFLPWQQ